MRRGARLPADALPGAIHVVGDLGEVRRLAEWLRGKCEAAGLGPMATIDLELAMVEAANNIVEHGAADSQIGLDFRIEGGTAVVTLADRGEPVPQGLYDQCRDVPLDATEGRGISIIRSCIDMVSYASRDGINQLTLTKLL
jgi:serine/threonine-protein kinase RsbW